MTGRNFEKLRKEQAISRLGYEPRDGMNLIPGKIRKRKSKAQLRAEAKGLTTPNTMITKMIECRCGHSGKVRIPLARSAGPFKCVVCGVSS
ncbi:hypothetical protein [Agrobacterium tumefaciens]|uniref:hypothetical protein n=1 Tax=Agrobacterium tumefaciens TaxID=358 RepID=UPI0028550F72|nr:hypothetical protein [Agrobacterium tumefaciens]MDR6589529.1 hypothetical protein [Agrobacterium tumefaciens]